MKNTDKSIRLRFHLWLFVIFILLFLTEVFIALFVNDRVIRPYGGDFLVVIMIYYFIKSFVQISYKYLLPFVLLFAYAIELCQLFDVVTILGLQDNMVIKTVLGTSFSWGDMIAYTLGIGLCYAIEHGLQYRLSK